MHEVARHQKRFGQSDDQRDGNVADIAVFAAEMEIGSPNGQDSSDEQGSENNQVTANMFCDVVCCVVVAHIF